MLLSLKQPLIKFLFVIVTAAVFSCNNNYKKLPFPEGETEFSAPSTEPLSFTDAEKISWRMVDLDTVERNPVRKISFNNLPTKPLKIVDFKPLKKPLTSKVFEWEKLPRIVYNVDNIRAEKISYRVSVLGEPKRIKASVPRLKDGASQSILLFGQDQGLPGTIGQSFVQDEQGLIWIGTDNGLCSYDGEFCSIYTMQEGLSNNWAKHLMAAKDGKIWIGTPGNGLDILDLRSGIIKHLGTEQGIPDGNIESIVQDRSGLVWVASRKGLVVIDEKAGTLKNFNSEVGMMNNLPASIFEDKDGLIWVGAWDGGIDIIDKKKNIIRHLDKSAGLENNHIIDFTQGVDGVVYGADRRGGVTLFNIKEGSIRNLNTGNGLSSNVLRSVVTDARGMIWIGSDGGGVDIYDAATVRIKNFNADHGLSNNNVYSLFSDSKGQVWIGTNGGEVNVYNSVDLKLQHFTSAQGLSNNTSFIYGLAEEKDGTLWVGSLGGGLDVIEEKKRTIKHLDIKNGLSDDRIYCLYVDSLENVWAGSLGGLDIINKKAGTIRNVTLREDFTCLLKHADGRMVMGTIGGLYMADKNYSLVKQLNSASGIKEVWSLAVDKNGLIWMGTNVGLDIVDENAGTVRHINSDPYLSSTTINTILPDGKGRVWVATSGGGVYMIDEANVATKFSVEQGLANNFALSLTEKNGNIYVGTGKGLSVISEGSNLKGKQKEWIVRSYGKPQGFARVDFNPRALLSRSGRLWWSEAEVLTAMDEFKQDRKPAVPAVQITGLEINERLQSFKKNKQWQVIFSQVDTVWNSEGIRYFLKTKYPADTGYLVEKHIRWDSLEGPGGLPVNLSLPHHQNHITFHYSGAQLANTDKTRYRYMLAGNDNEWSVITDKPFADYRNLEPGTYTFRVRSRGFDGTWSNEASLKFKIRLPWWQRWWAYVIYALFAALFIKAYVGYRSRNLVRKNKILEERISDRTAQLRQSIEDLRATQNQLVQSEKMASLGELTAGIAHEIQNPLNFVNNFAEVSTELVGEMKYELQEGDKEEAIAIAGDLEDNLKKITHHGRRAEAIVKGMLEHSRTSTGKKEPTDINALADEYLRLSYHGLRAKDNSFNANFKTDFDETIGKVEAVPQDLGRVLLNLFNNAFYSVNEKKKAPTLKGENYEPTVSVTTKRIISPSGVRGVEIIVRDNGVGIPQKVLEKIYQPFFTTKPTGQGTGLGLSLSYDIITKGHNGEMKVETREGEYALFIIRLPLT